MANGIVDVYFGENGKGYATLGQAMGMTNNSWFDNITSPSSTTWKGNVLNASLTGLFTGLSQLGGVFSARKIYDYYNKQQAEYIQNASEMARRYQLRGDLALSKLQVQHALAQGANELSVAVAGGNLSGSNLDKLVANYRYNQRDEKVQKIETLWQVADAKRDGYLKALSASFSASNFAFKQKANAFNALSSMAKTMVQEISADVKQEAQQKAAMAAEAQRQIDRNRWLDYWMPQIKEATQLNIVDIGQSNSIEDSLRLNPIDVNNEVGDLDVWKYTG